MYMSKSFVPLPHILIVCAPPFNVSGYGPVRRGYLDHEQEYIYEFACALKTAYTTFINEAILQRKAASTTPT